MAILLLGKEGQLATDILDVARDATSELFVNIVALGKYELDITDKSALESVIDSIQPKTVINAAAYTAVDDAEEHQELAEKVNHYGVQQLTDLCLKYSARLIHVSTDYVFDGNQKTAYKPDDSVAPINVYGETKQRGEVAALLGSDNLVLRASWLYSYHHKNFLTTMLRLFQDKEEVRVVNDQIGGPTYSPGLADIILRAVDTKLTGIYHWCDKGEISWFEFAQGVADIAHNVGLINSLPSIKPVTSSQYATKAKRPRFTVLDCQSTCRDLGVHQVSWQENVEKALIRIKSNLDSGVL